MKPLILARAMYLKKYIDVLNEMDIQTSDALTQFHLPSQVDDRTDCYLPIANGVGFLRQMEWQNEVDDLGSLVAERLVLGDLHQEVSAHVQAGPNLHSALVSLAAFCHRENTQARFWLVGLRDTVRVCSSVGIAGPMPGLQFSEWIQNMVVVLAVRAFAGSAWQPAEMGFQSLFCRSGAARERFPNTRLTTGQGCAFVTVPRSLLSRPAPASPAPIPAYFLPASPKPDIGASLKLLLRSYINGDVRLSLQGIAEIVGTSARNLQRELARTGRTYRDILAEARFETAVCLMRDPAAKIIDIAYATGYDDPSHFTRAFRRYAGVSPREYRARRFTRALKPSPVLPVAWRHSNTERNFAG